ncbi:MAG: hypothetical protein HC927_03960 [Deltaproteobacteria bacterium]|nr:hypothetical protein [Deltaproteobacteria bacterium]
MACLRSSLGVSLASLLVLLACQGRGSEDDEVGEGESGSETAGESETETAGEELLVDVAIELHPNQPMVVDVHVQLSEPGFVTLTHLEDPGVKVARLDGEGPATDIWLRVRGLAPDTLHALELGVGTGEGAASEVHPVELTTNPPLPGYIESFPLTLDVPAEVDDDYRFFDLSHYFAAGSPSLFMIDKTGRTRWHYGVDVDFVYLNEMWVGLKLREDGSVLALRTDAALIYDELGEELMRVEAEQFDLTYFHHEIIELPSGNFMTLTFSFQDVEYEGEGLLPVAGDRLLEFTPAGELVWTWDTFDHLDPQRRRDGFYGSAPIINPETRENAYDWTHANGMLYRDGVIYVSFRHQDWILAIEHATGEILWKLGDEGDFALGPDSTWFFHQHSPEWQPDGSLLMYDNAVGNPDQEDSAAHSRAVRYVLDMEGMVATQVWQDDDAKFVSSIAGDADRTSLGHVLRLDSTMGGVMVYSRLRELVPDRTPNAVWSLDLPPGMFAYRAVPTPRLVGE